MNGFGEKQGNKLISGLKFEKKIRESKHLICDNGIKKNNDVDCKLNARENVLAM